MARVRVEPSGLDLELHEDESIMVGAHRLGYSWPTICGGEASCKVCVMEVREGADGLSPMENLERAALEETFRSLERHGVPIRLACQAKASGDVVVFKRGVKKRGNDG